jgi:hypothetical protein
MPRSGSLSPRETRKTAIFFRTKRMVFYKHIPYRLIYMLRNGSASLLGDQKTDIFHMGIIYHE